MTSSNDCNTDEHTGNEIQSSCFMPTDAGTVHAETHNIEGLMYEPSPNGK